MPYCSLKLYDFVPHICGTVITHLFLDIYIVFSALLLLYCGIKTTSVKFMLHSFLSKRLFLFCFLRLSYIPRASRIILLTCERESPLLNVPVWEKSTASDGLHRHSFHSHSVPNILEHRCDPAPLCNHGLIT